jgi:hypothetical protein
MGVIFWEDRERFEVGRHSHKCECVQFATYMNYT